MNKYRKLKERQLKEINEFPIIFAFNQKQLIEGMEKLGLKENETEKLLKIGGNGFIRKSDRKALNELIERHEIELRSEIQNDLTGEGFIFDMFNYELANHEYCITLDVEETIQSIGLTLKEVRENENLRLGLKKAIKEQRYY